MLDLTGRSIPASKLIASTRVDRTRLNILRTENGLRSIRTVQETACAVVRAFRQAKLLFPRRLRGGPQCGELLWQKLA
jgi:hypothetical protein